MGIVFRAFDPMIHRNVAIKVVKLPDDASSAQRDQYRERILREIRSVGRLSHSGIVIVHHSGEDQGFPYIVMEFVEGQSLEKLLEYAPLDKTVALPLLKQISAALDYAHSQGVIHRDVKPANIMVRADGNIKIMDFGIAKAAGEMTLTLAGSILGTPSYMSPEQVRGKPLDGCSDQFSLAVIAFCMATGRKPFVADDIFALFQKILNESASAPSKINPALPSQVDAVLAKALTKQPHERYPVCVDFARALEAVWSQPYRDVVTIATPPTRKQQDVATITTPPTRKQRRVAATAKTASLARLLGGLLQGLWLTPRPQLLSQYAIRIYTFVFGAFGLIVAIGMGLWLIQRGPTRDGTHPPSQVAETLLKPTETPNSKSPPDKKEDAVGVEVNPKDGLKYVSIPPGTFTMGCSAGDSECYQNEKPAHQVTITKGFWIGQTEVTQAAYERVMGKNPSLSEGANRPVETGRERFEVDTETGT
jgi:serine/threonine protein kinase